ncbi:hypothetical protein ACVW0Y_001126 [Pseudomonas sp. TE3786]
MSDYFAALLRASGLDAATVDSPAGEDAGLPEVETFTAAPASAAPTETVPAAQARQAQVVIAEQQPAMPAEPRANVVSQPLAVAQPVLEPAALTQQPVIHPSTATPPADAPINQQALLQSVLRWVASDPQPSTAHEAASLTASSLNLPTSVAVASAAPAAPAAFDSAVFNAPQPLVAEPLVTPPNQQQASIAIAAPAAVSAGINQPATQLQPPAASFIAALPETPATPTEQPISVSIGAIHLRVEAPPAPAQPVAALKPGTGKASAAPRGVAPVRSGLSRRALRHL